MNKRSFWVAGFGVGMFALSVAQSSFGITTLSNNESKRGLQIAPVTLNLHGLNKTKVGLGSYIVNAQGGCNDCHTNPSYTANGDPHNGDPEQINAAHYLAGGQHFGPNTVSANITPDSQGHPAGMTLSEFIQTIRTGRHMSTQPLQVMPWPVYSKMTDKDLTNVYEYLRAIPHAEPGP